MTKPTNDNRKQGQDRARPQDATRSDTRKEPQDYKSSHNDGTNKPGGNTQKGSFTWGQTGQPSKVTVKTTAKSTMTQTKDNQVRTGKSAPTNKNG